MCILGTCILYWEQGRYVFKYKSIVMCGAIYILYLYTILPNIVAIIILMIKHCLYVSSVRTQSLLYYYLDEIHIILGYLFLYLVHSGYSDVYWL